jgi:hypothetical protein
MKKTVFVLLMVSLLLSLALPVVAMAGYGADDPKLCVEGKWLTVDAAAVSAVRVTVPEGTHYGDKKAGGCKTKGPDVPMIQNVVVERGEHNVMRVSVDGKYATPKVTATYGDAVLVKNNNGSGTLNFLFSVR